MDDLEFRVLGPLEMLRAGVRLPLTGTTIVSVLAGLLVSANHVVSADRLAEVVWGDDVPVHPRGSLQSAVSRLRRFVGDEAIETANAGYRLHVDTDRLDLLCFERNASEAAGTERGEDCVAALERAMHTWRGAPLSNVESVTLHREVVPGLTERYLAVCEKWGESSLRLGRHQAVAEEFAGLVGTYPFRERLVGQYMVALSRSGRRADALAVFDSLRRRIGDELGIDPSPVLQRLQLQVLRGTDDQAHFAPATTSRHDRPRWRGRGPAPGELVGRDEDADVLAKALQAHHAVTVVGAGGVGKTRLALHSARQVAADFDDGVVVVELGPLPVRRTGEIDALVEAAGAAIGIRGNSSSAPLEVLLAELGTRDLLMVFDNAEHVVAGCAQLVDLIVRSCPQVRVITTSRRPLGLVGELIVELRPLAHDAAARLLRLRVAEQRGDELSADPADVAELCRLIEGLPLAVELAAARLRTMSLTELLDRIPGRLDLLTIKGRPGLPHQSGLMPTLEWSHDLLTERHRLLLGRLAVFADSFTLADAESMCGHAPLVSADVAGLLADLVDDSLVQASRGVRYRYRLLVPIREFALSRVGPVTSAGHDDDICSTYWRLPRVQTRCQWVSAGSSVGVDVSGAVVAAGARKTHFL